jgi:hypothetical protein
MSSFISRKLSTLWADPIGSAKYRGRRELRRVLHGWGEHNLRENGAIEVLSAFLKKRPSSAIPPDFADLWFLYQTVRHTKPRVILEFGSGCSTVILAHALRQNERDDAKSRGYLYSVDADPDWAEMTARSMPDDLRTFCEVSYSALIEIEHEGTLGFQHATVPNVIPNFLYLDGPGFTSERQVAVDVLNIEDKLPSDFRMVVDGRTKNTLFLKQHLKRNYRFKENKLLFSYVFELAE